MMFLFIAASISSAGVSRAVRYPVGVTVFDNVKLRGYLAVAEQIVSPSTLGTVTLDASYGRTLIKSAATVGTLNVVLPAVTNLPDGYMHTIVSIPAITVLSITAADSTTIRTAATSMTALSRIAYMYSKTDGKWYTQ